MVGVKSLLRKLPRNKYAKVAIISATVGLAFLLLPFALFGLISMFAYEKITSPKLKYAVVGTLVIFGLLIGIPWTGAFFSDSSTANNPKAPINNTEVPTQTSQPKIEKQTITETQEIPFEETTINDPNLEAGKSRVKTVGAKGVKILTYEITFTNGIQTDKKLTKEEVTIVPTNQIVAVGTKVKTSSSNCDPNYTGACVPIASDVDCAGGTGNGPAYVKGPVYVIGVDIYDLDRDGNGIGCER